MITFILTSVNLTCHQVSSDPQKNQNRCYHTFVYFLNSRIITLYFSREVMFSCFPILSAPQKTPTNLLRFLGFVWVFKFCLFVCLGVVFFVFFILPFIWRYSKFVWAWSWSRWLCLSSGIGSNNLDRSLPASAVVWFCSFRVWIPRWTTYMIKTMELLRIKEPTWRRYLSKMMSLHPGSDNQDQQFVTICLIIQTKHGWNRTTLDKLCNT